MTATGRTGGLHLVSSPLPGVESVVEAMGIQVMHLISDVGTSTGLPIPGWGLLSANGATVGGRSVAEIAREMYVRGYDSWHLLSMSTVPASVELSCRLYWGLRSSLDPSFEQQTDSVGDDPRYQAISLLAHGVAAACDAAQFAITGNPLTLNWAEWMVFAKKLSDWLKATSPRPTTLLAQQFTANRQYLDSGWDRVWAGSVPELPLHKVC